MNYQDVMQFIKSTQQFGSKPGLERIKKLADLLGNPQDSLRFIHIAGTNGKGSTACFISNILKNAGFDVGLYTSPFIYEFNERIRRNNENISDADLTEVMIQVKGAVDQMLAMGEEHPTEFEIITTAAFLYFKMKKCEIVVLEVGLGGRFDATNIIKAPLISVITSIGLDHTEFLGNTITQIAFEKCGIIKEGGRTVCYCEQDQEAKEVIQTIAKERNNSLVLCDKSSLLIKECSLEGSVFHYQEYQNLKLQMLGEYQIYNGITAINVIKELQNMGWSIDRKAVYEGLLQSNWLGRFEKIADQPLFIVDGSHNLDGVKAFIQTIKKVLAGKKIIAIFGMLKDKEYKEAIHILSEAAEVFIATKVNSPRTAQAVELAGIAKQYMKEVYWEEDNQNAVLKAYALSKPEDAIVAIGSLYMLADIKKSVEESHEKHIAKTPKV